jgi:hypothetical protein
LGFPFVSVCNQLLLVVKKLFVKEGCVFKIWSFYDSVYRAGFLAETAENALGHIYIIFSCSAGSVRAGLTFNCNGKGRAGSFAKLASDATLLTSRVPSKCVLTTEHGG